MIRVALKDLLGRKLRLVLTSLAIVMGVAMVSGTFVLTDAINAGFKAIFTTAFSTSDAVITGKAVFGGTANAPSFPASTLARVRALPDVAAAAGGIEDSAQIVGRDGKVVGSQSGAPGLAFSVDASGDQEFNPLSLVVGHWPSGGHEVAIDETTASAQHFRVGDTVGVLARAGLERHYTLSGIVTFANSTSLGGATLAIFDLPAAQALFHKQGELDQIDVATRAGVSRSDLLAQIQKVLPPHTEVRTGQQEAKQQADQFGSVLKIIRYFLLAFGGIALFVGAFVIANTLSITIAQRMREFATLRCVGAEKAQVLQVVVAEGLVTGLLASVVGLFAGFGLAKLIDAVFKAVGLNVPETPLAIATRTVIVALAVGTVVTVLASLRPALRATRVPPIAAVREGSVLPPSRFARFGPLLATAVCVVSLALVAYGAFGHGATGPRLAGMGVGVLGLFVGVAMVAPSFARPLASALGRPAAAIGGVAGQLARSNSMRNPARTASTAAALMIGLALVTTVALLAQDLKAAARSAVSSQIDADYTLTSQNGFLPTSIDSATALRRAGVATVVAGERSGEGRAFGATVQVSGLDPGIGRVMRFDWLQGSDRSLDRLGSDGAVVDGGYASSHHLGVGSRIRLETPGGKFLSLHVTAIVKPQRFLSELGTISISSAAFDAVYPTPEDVFALIDMPGGVTAANTKRLNALLERYPDAKIQTESQFVSSQVSGVDNILVLFYVLLGLSIVVSLFGIVNTLVLTVFERTREIGMLRAVGMTRRQIRRMIRHESVITALLGAALGIPVGFGLAAVFGRAIRDVPFAVPWLTIVAFVVAAIAVGLLAAIFPARRAARLNVLEALQYE